jgi:very-short-patch-repair endonuclease
MGDTEAQRRSDRGVWRLVHAQHGVITRRQLLQLGFSSKAVAHRIAVGRLHRVGQGIYAVGRPELSRHGRLMAAVLGCGPDALLSHESAAGLWGLRAWRAGAPIDVAVPPHLRRRRPGVRVHRRQIDAREREARDGIPLTGVARTLVDLGGRISRRRLEAAVNEADKLDLIDPEALRAEIALYSGRAGVRPLRTILDRQTFALTDSELERRFLAICRGLGLPMPETGQRLDGFKVDFHWPALGLVVETDGLRYHRTPAQQARDRLRDQAHTAAGRTPLRFTYAQVRYERAHVRATLEAVVRRLAR